MKHPYIYSVLIAAALPGVALLAAYGLVLPGLVLAGLALAGAAYLFAPEGAYPPLSKEEELARWNVRWESDDPALTDHLASRAAGPRLRMRPGARG